MIRFQHNPNLETGSTMKYLPKARNNNIVVQSLKDEVLIYDKAVDKAFCLNKTASIVWNLCDEKKTIFEISRELSDNLRSLAGEDFVWLALAELKQHNLLINAEALPERYKGLSRREVIRRVAVASAVTLPLITGIVAPTVAAAQSVTICAAAGSQATAIVSNSNGQGLLTCLSEASKKCCNVPPFAFQSSGPNFCDGFTCSCTFDCK
jgi:hypothetical protein